MLGILKRLFGYDTYHDIIDCLASALEARDLYTGGHSTRVGDLTYDLARSMGIKGSALNEIHMAAHLHDIGKIGVPEAALNKQGKLLPHEWAQVQQHPEIGWRILSKSQSLRRIAEIVLHHHERWDGKGYPHGLGQDHIPLGARIIAVADSVDAMTSDRPYRKAMSWEQCRNEVDINKAIQFDPVIVDAAAKHWKSWQSRYQKNSFSEMTDETGEGTERNGIRPHIA